MVKTSKLLEEGASTKTRGQRLQRLRNIANLTRRELVEKAKINIHTLRGWENGIATGLTRRGAEKTLKAVEAEGVICSCEWLMHGIGSGPRIVDKLEIKEETAEYQVFSRVAEEKQIIKELQIFRQGNPGSIDLVVTDDGMMPSYRVGDYVAGIQRHKNRIKTLVGMDCIIKTNTGRILLRRLKKSTKKNKYNLACINPDTSVKEPVLYETELASAAPIIWIRRRDEID